MTPATLRDDGTRCEHVSDCIAEFVARRLGYIQVDHRVFRTASARSITRFLLRALPTCPDPQCDIAIVTRRRALTQMCNKPPWNSGVSVKPRDRRQHCVASSLKHRLALVGDSRKIVGILPLKLAEVLLPSATFGSLDTHLGANLD